MSNNSKKYNTISFFQLFCLKTYFKKEIMERRHQVFISSTYADLKDERSEVTQALLELDCIPAGMEIFPATTQNAWQLIKGVIDDSDYYCLIIGGRYGSTDAEGIGYTEKEYDYATARLKPLIAFIHGEPNEIPSGKAENTDLGREKLKLFRDKVESAHHCKYWKTASELGGLVSRSLVNLRKTNPAEGWIRGRFAATETMLIELANLKAKVAELTADAVIIKSSDEENIIESLASGTDIFSGQCSYIEIDKKERSSSNVALTWDGILKYVGPSLLNECSDNEFDEKLKLCFHHGLKSKANYASIVLPHVLVDQIKVQLRALGQMIPGTKRRAVADKQSYWRLTALGEKRLLSASAIHKKVSIQNEANQ